MPTLKIPLLWDFRIPRKHQVLVNPMLTIQYFPTYKMSTHNLERRETLAFCELLLWCMEENKTTVNKFLSQTSFPLGYENEVKHYFQFYKCYPSWVPLVVQWYSTKTNKQGRVNKCYWRSQHSWRNVILLILEGGVFIVILLKGRNWSWSCFRKALTYLKCSQESGNSTKIDNTWTHFYCWIWMIPILM